MFKISVIISTYNGRHKILETLQALESQTFRDFDTIVVIDGSTDGTKEMLDSQKLDLYSFKIIEQHNKGRACVRNNGAKLAGGEILIFYDDDMTPEQDSVYRHVNFHQDFPNAICGGNPIEDEANAATDFDFFRCNLRKRWSQKYDSGFNKITQDNLFLSAANFSVSKAVFFNIGKFNEHLNDAEDLEFAFKALNKGYNIYFDTLNMAWHRDFISCKNYIKRRREYYTAYSQLKTILPELFNDEKRIIKLNFFKKMVFSFFSHSFWVKAIDRQNLTFISKPVRYKIYDWVVTGLGSVFLYRHLK